MIRRTEHENGVVTFQSDLLREAGVRHAFSTRIGGVSRPPYDTLNLGYLTKELAPDDNTDVAENFRRLRKAVGLERYYRVQVNQVHGAEVYVPPMEPRRLRDSPAADAIVTDIVGSTPTIRTADCVPLLMASRDGRVVAAVHAGWRGVVAGVIPAAIRAMGERFGVPAQEIVAAVGPCIGVEAFEVGEEVAAEFAKAGLPEAVRREGGSKPHIDLYRAALAQLGVAGLSPGSVDGCDRCTSRDQADFFSHRRDRGVTGRMAAVIAVKG